MTDLNKAISRLEDPMIDLDTMIRAMRTLTALLSDDRGNSMHSVLFFLANHLEHIHADLYAKLDALGNAAKDGPKLVG